MPVQRRRHEAVTRCGHAPSHLALDTVEEAGAAVAIGEPDCCRVSTVPGGDRRHDLVCCAGAGIAGQRALMVRHTSGLRSSVDDGVDLDLPSFPLSTRNDDERLRTASH
jgi:hypothetical protein